MNTYRELPSEDSSNQLWAIINSKQDAGNAEECWDRLTPIQPSDQS
jgi:hypothetical protein